MASVEMAETLDDLSPDECFFCRKSAGLEGEPLGGYVIQNDTWIANHAKPHVGHPGTLILSTRRHFLDFTEMTDEEMDSLHEVMRKVVPAIKKATGASRVYFLSMMAGMPHFHVWLIPQQPDSELKAFELLGSERICSEADVLATSDRLRANLKSAA
jgi:diadenosine tetraphosphate (Ap4A) HIT family hydrolase